MGERMWDFVSFLAEVDGFLDRLMIMEVVLLDLR
jgi:hypothetical protein